MPSSKQQGRAPGFTVKSNFLITSLAANSKGEPLDLL